MERVGSVRRILLLGLYEDSFFLTLGGNVYRRDEKRGFCTRGFVLGHRWTREERVVCLFGVFINFLHNCRTPLEYIRAYILTSYTPPRIHSNSALPVLKSTVQRGEYRVRHNVW